MAGQKHGLREMLADQVKIVNNHQYGSSFRMPARDQGDQVELRLLIDSVERLVE